jgi:hypothetical protein
MEGRIEIILLHVKVSAMVLDLMESSKHDACENLALVQCFAH